MPARTAATGVSDPRLIGTQRLPVYSPYLIHDCRQDLSAGDRQNAPQVLLRKTGERPSQISDSHSHTILLAFSAQRRGEVSQGEKGGVNLFGQFAVQFRFFFDTFPLRVVLESLPVGGCLFTAGMLEDVDQGVGLLWFVDGIENGNTSAGTIASTSDTTASYSPSASTQPGSHSVTAKVSCGTLSPVASFAVTDLTGVFTHHNDNARTGQNTKEYALTPATVSVTTFGKLFSCTLDSPGYSQRL